MVEVTQADRDAYGNCMLGLDCGNLPRVEELEAAVADIARERNELAEALREAEDALRGHACHAEGAPCRRSKIECLAECGFKAGNALMAIASALAKLDAGKVQP